MLSGVDEVDPVHDRHSGVALHMGETADIGGALNTKGTAMAAVIATATAYQTSIGSQS